MTERLDDEAQTQYLSLLIDSGCKIVFSSWHFGKPYVWMKDRAGGMFMERVPDSMLERIENA